MMQILYHLPGEIDFKDKKVTKDSLFRFYLPDDYKDSSTGNQDANKLQETANLTAPNTYARQQLEQSVVRVSELEKEI
jgi:hypothetical protein